MFDFSVFFKPVFSIVRFMKFSLFFGHGENQF